MRQRAVYLYICVILIVAVWPLISGAETMKYDLTGFFQSRWDVYEQNENHVDQAVSGDDAEDVASGFGVRRARVILNLNYPDAHLSGKIHIRFEDPVALYDMYALWDKYPFLMVTSGQMKFPTQYEILVSASALDFCDRSLWARNMVEWSLARTPYASDLSTYKSLNRDVGLGLKGDLKFDKDYSVLRYFLFVGNGLGANKSIGGPELKGDMESNHPGQYLYAARVEFSPIKAVNIGGHWNQNMHHDMLYKDEKTVYDIKRDSYSADLRVTLPQRIRFIAAYGSGIVNDGHNAKHKIDLMYQGYNFDLLWGMIEQKVELGVRYETYGWETAQDHNWNEYRNTTFGVNLIPVKATRLQINYTHKDFIAQSPGLKNLDDDIFLMLLQVQFGPFQDI